MRPDSAQRGFSLIEIIAAMSVLAIIMLLIGQAYTSVNGSWRDGMVISDQNSGGRAALAFMARELSQAVVDDPYQLVVHTDVDGYAPYGNFKDSSIWFTTLSSFPSNSTQQTRQAQDIRYYVIDGEDGAFSLVGFTYRNLQRIGNYSRAELDCVKAGSIEDSLGGTSQMHASNGTDLLNFIRRFEVTLYCADRTNTSLKRFPVVARAVSATSLDKYDSKGSDSGKNKTSYYPVYADLYLEVLGQDVAQVVAESGMSAADKVTYCEKNSQRFTTRVFFANAKPLAGIQP